MLAMESDGVEMSPVPSPFWALIALLRQEPGMGWLLRSPGACAGSWRPTGVEADSEQGAGECAPEGIGWLGGEVDRGLGSFSMGSDP